MIEIVAAQTGSIITNDPRKIAVAVADDTVTRFLSRWEMSFMAMFDLGKKWENLSKSRTLFSIDEKTGQIVYEEIKE